MLSTRADSVVKVRNRTPFREREADRDGMLQTVSREAFTAPERPGQSRGLPRNLFIEESAPRDLWLALCESPDRIALGLHSLYGRK